MFHACRDALWFVLKMCLKLCFHFHNLFLGKTNNKELRSPLFIIIIYLLVVFKTQNIAMIHNMNIVSDPETEQSLAWLKLLRLHTSHDILCLLLGWQHVTLLVICRSGIVRYVCYTPPNQSSVLNTPNCSTIALPTT